MLNRMGESVQQVAEAIASVLGVEVTIVDDTMQRIAGTGCYADRIGDKLAQDSVFARVLKNGKGFVIANPGEHSACITCQGREHCIELAEVCCPIKYKNRTIGVIALIAFTDSQRQTLLEQQYDLFGFIDRMADLLTGKVAELETLHQIRDMKKQIETIINTVQEGIIAVDSGGNIVNLNTSAAEMLSIEGGAMAGKPLAQVLPGISVEHILSSGQGFANRETSCQAKGRRHRYMVSARLWTGDGAAKGVVLTLREMSEVRKFVSHFSTQTFCYTLDMILGQSRALGQTKAAAAKAAASASTVLIQGESGTGKELFARAIHCGGDRRDKPFLAINCAAIPEALLESELFGYEEGAFTGARRGGKPGKFELADGGTLFLDEIGDMSLTLQAKLLRVLQERCIERVGGMDGIPVDVRIIAATHKDLDSMVKNGEFRQDLFYRINVFPIAIPALRERREDIPLLIDSFLERYCASFGKPLLAVESDAYQILLDYSWPGNVRELENTVEYLVNVEAGGSISRRSLPAKIAAHSTPLPGVTGIVPLAALEKSAIQAALQRFGFSVEGKGKAAEALGISKATLYRKLKEYGEVFSK